MYDIPPIKIKNFTCIIKESNREKGVASRTNKYNHLNFSVMQFTQLNNIKYTEMDPPGALVVGSTKASLS